MYRGRFVKFAFVLSLSLAALVLLGGVAVAQSASLQGVINGRNGATMTVQSPGVGNTVVVLTDDTQVEDVSGLFHARKKQMGLTALVPGLQVDVQGTYNAQNQLVASTVKFNGKNLQTATDIQAGVTPVEQQEQQQQQQLAQQQAQAPAATGPDPGDRRGAGEARAGNRCPAGCHCRGQQALWRAGRVQHLG